MVARSKRTAPNDEVLPDRVIKRSDGYYWESKEKGETYGPFTTLAEAELDMLSGGGDDYEGSDTLQQAESELGISEWIDPDSGVPAEDSVPRLEDH